MENKEGKVNFKFVISGLVFTIILLWMVSAITITYHAPGNYTFNATSDRNINFTFTPVWSGNQENATTNCSLWLNSTTDGLDFGWNPVKNISNGTLGEGDALTNNSLSYMNYTFASDGNYTWAIGCWNESNSTTGQDDSGVAINFSIGNSTLIVDATAPVANASFNSSTLNLTSMNNVINFSGNVTDNIGLTNVTITYNASNEIVYVNFSDVHGGNASSLTAVVTLTGGSGTVINFSMSAKDTSGNTYQNSTLLNLVDDVLPVVNTTFNVSSPQVRDVINFTANITDNVGLLSANWTVNLTSGTQYMNLSVSGASAERSNFTTLAGREDVLNFTLYVTDTNNNVKQNSTLITVADTIAPTFNFTIDSNMPINGSNQTSTTLPVINISILDTYGMGINLTTANGTVNISIEGGGSTLVAWLYTTQESNVSCIGNSGAASDASTEANCSVSSTVIADAVNFSNGTYTIRIDVVDAGNSTNGAYANTTFTIDNIAPVFDYYNMTGTAALDASGEEVEELNNSVGRSMAQGATIYAYANWTDNLTQPSGALLQFYNTTGTWTTVNTSINDSSYQSVNAYWTNLSYTIQKGHDMFEGGNVSFRIIANDTLGNVNDSASVKNFTIWINDTTVPTITINGTLAVNNSNFTTTSVAVVSWAVDENNPMAEINISIDGAVNNVDGCDKFARYTDAAGPNNADLYRNYSFSTSTDSACTLGNGSHFMEVQARDSWGNVEVYFHNFTVESGMVPSINLTGLGNGTSGSTDILNGSVVTPYTGINFTALDGTTSTIKNLTFTSSCNSTVQDFAVGQTPQVQNLSFIWPFNYTGCKGTEANHTVDITVYDFAGNTLTKHYQFQVDDVAPTITVHSPTDGYSTTGKLDLNVSAFDDMSRIDSIGYYLDGDLALLNHTVKNGSFLTDAQGQNTSDVYGDELNRTINYTGTHTIVVSVNDTMGNQYNSSSITFTMVGPIRPNEINESMNTYITTLLTVPSNVTIRLKDSAGEYNDIGSANESDSGQTFEIFLDLNSSNDNDNVNVTITEINGSGANWDKINFSVLINETRVEAGIENNFTADLFDFVWFNESFDEFLSNPNDYYATILLPYNISGTASTAQEIWYFPDSNDFTNRTNVSQCTAAFTRTTLVPCWNYSGIGKTLLSVPHFDGGGGAGNDSTIPTVNINKPATTQDTTGGFVPNITVSADAVSCEFQPKNVTASTSSASGNTSSAGTLANNICTWGEVRFKNGAYNITFNATDANGNENQSDATFTVSDTTSPNSGIISSSVTGSTTATVTITGVNESVNATVWYGANSSSSTAAEVTTSVTTGATDFATTQEVTLTGLTAETRYYYNVTLRDYNGQVKRNGTFTFTTDAAAAAATTTTTSSGSSGGGVAAGAASNVQASKAQVWSSVAAGTSLTMTVNKAQIGITEITVGNVVNELSNAEIKASSLNDNPVSESAAGRVFQYLQINKKNMGDDDVTDITIKFRVTKTWLSENGLTQGDVALWRYKNNVWTMLSTTFASSDETYVYYEADTPGFSYFAIGNKVGGTTAFAIIDMIRGFYEGTSSLTAFDIIDNIRSFYGG